MAGGGTFIRTNSTDNRVHKENKGEYDTLATALAPHGIVNALDLGANDGFSSWLLAATNPATTVYAVEPMPGNYAMVALNAGLLARGRVVPLLAGAWATETTIDVESGFGDWADTTREGGSSGGENKTSVAGLPVARIMDMLCVDHWDLVKMDIEGAEQSVMGGDQGKAWLRRTRYLYAEVHPHMEHESLRVSLAAMFDAGMHVFTFPTLEHPALAHHREWLYFACADDIGRDACLATCEGWRSGSELTCTYLPPSEASILAEYAHDHVLKAAAAGRAAVLQPQ